MVVLNSLHLLTGYNDSERRHMLLSVCYLPTCLYFSAVFNTKFIHLKKDSTSMSHLDPRHTHTNFLLGHICLCKSFKGHLLRAITLKINGIPVRALSLTLHMFVHHLQWESCWAACHWIYGMTEHVLLLRLSSKVNLDRALGAAWLSSRST